MKKTLVLASLLAAFGAASAQSSVTMYGFLDEGIGRAIVADSAASAKLVVNPGTSDIGGFRFGIRGTEAIGGGLMGKFGIEASDTDGTTGTGKGAAAENGTAGVPGFNLGTRAAWVGVAGGFGEVRIGRHATIGVMNAGSQTNFGWRGTNSQAKLGLRGGIDYQDIPVTVTTATTGTTAAAGVGANPNGANSRVSGAITFLSANYSGFTFAGQAALADNNKYNGTSKQGYTALAAGYAAGPLKVEGYMSNAGGMKSTYLGGQYNFGMVTAGLGYTANENMAAVANKGITARAKASFGAADVGLEFTKQTTGLKQTGIELGMDYNLSPRTALTIALNKTTNFQAGYYAGVRHGF
jgi:general bacterial porin, GBP family